MPDRKKIVLGNVQKTLFLPLWGRAYETQRLKPRLIDKIAVEILGRVDVDFSTMAKNLSPITQRGWISRSLLVDKTVRAFLQEHPGGTIINIGCGLDTTFERVDNGKLHWYDLDLPDVIALRKEFIGECDRRKFIASSFLDDAWLQLLRNESHILFIAAGVFYYFEGDQIKDFFRRLADLFPGSELVFDASSPQGVRIANKLVIKNSGLDENSFLKWGIKNTRELSSWDRRIKILKELSYFKGMRSDLPFKQIVGTFVSDLLKIQWLVHLKFDRE